MHALDWKRAPGEPQATMFPDAPPAITTTVLAPAETPGAQLGTSVSYAESYLAACREYPDAQIRVSR